MVTLELPGDLTIFDIDWLSIYDVASKQNLGSVIIPDDPNVPPSLAKISVSFPIEGSLRCVLSCGLSNAFSFADSQNYFTELHSSTQEYAS